MLRLRIFPVLLLCALVGSLVFVFTSVSALSGGESWMQHLSIFGESFVSDGGGSLAGTDVQGLSKRAHAAGDVVTVSQVRIVNNSGTTVAVIGSDTDGHGGLWFYNKNGKEISWMGGDPSGHGHLRIRNASENSIVSVGALASGEGSGVLGVFGDSDAFSELSVSREFGAAVRVSNRKGQVVSAILADERGNGALGTLSASGNALAGMVSDMNGNGVVETYSSDSNLRWSSEIPSINVSPPTGLLGDLDGDGDVDFTDFLVFAQNFGKTSG